jgi:hypothetical protein
LFVKSSELTKDFDKLYIIDLHGNARIGETAEDGSLDQNVFDIMQGVCIIILVKNDDIKDKGIFHIDLYGKRKDKFKFLHELQIGKINPTQPPLTGEELGLPSNTPPLIGEEATRSQVGFYNTALSPNKPPLVGEELGLPSNTPPLIGEEATRSQVGFVTPEQILAFIYAQMHSPDYRIKYLELLKIDFPRINFDVSQEEFTRLAGIGQELIDAHLMRRIPDLQIGSFVSKIGFENIICQKPTYNPLEQRIYLSTELDKEVYFEGVSPEIWSFKIGGYQVLDKYFKERTGRILSNHETTNISNIIKVLGLTIACNAKIDSKTS